MFNFLSKKDTNIYLLNQQNFSSKYQLTTQSCFTMGKENSPIHVSSTAAINLKQTVEKKKIYTKISVTNMTSETDNNNLKESIQEMLLFAKINPVIEFIRFENGSPKDIDNMPDIWEAWERWKEKQLPNEIPNELKQQKIIKNYENGLKSLEDTVYKNMQYMLLLPGCYKFRHYPDPLECTFEKTYSSRFVEKLDISYYLNKKSFSDKNNIVKLTLGTQIADDENKELVKRLETFYENNMPDFSFKDYLFDIKIQYTFDKNTSEIFDAHLSFIEKLHSNFSYTIEMDLINAEREKKIIDKTPIKSEEKEKNNKRWSTLVDDGDDNIVIG